VLFRPIPAEAPEEERAAAREALLRGFESKAVIDIAEPPVAASGDGDGEFTFRAGELESSFSAAEMAAMDVRDKDELAALRRGRRRDVLMWRAAMACIAGFVLLGLGELALVGGGLWQTTRRVQLNAQAPAVEQIETANDIAHRIEDLRTKRL